MVRELLPDDGTLGNWSKWGSTLPKSASGKLRWITPPVTPQRLEGPVAVTKPTRNRSTSPCLTSNARAQRAPATRRNKRALGHSGLSPTRRHHQACRADDAGFVGDLLFHNGHVAAQQTARAVPHLILQRDQEIGTGVGHVAAQDDDLRVEDVQQSGQRCAELVDGAGDNREG